MRASDLRHKIPSTGALVLVAAAAFALLIVGASPAMAGTAVFSDASPPPGSSVSESSLTVSVDFDDTVPFRRAWVTVDGASRPVVVTLVPGDSTAGTLSSDVSGLSNGSHTIKAMVYNTSWKLSTYTWSFTVDPAAPPVLSNPSPAPGSLVATTFPTVRADVDGTVSSCQVYMDGIAVPTVLEDGTISGTLLGPLPNDVVCTATVDVSGPAGSDTLEWDFYVQIYPQMPDTIGDACATCHTDMYEAHPMGDCDACHGNPSPVGMGGLPPEDYEPGGPEHPSSYLDEFPGACVDCHTDTYAAIPVHPVPEHRSTTDMSDCGACHVSDLLAEHYRRDDGEGHALDCTSCHLSDDPAVEDAIENGLTECFDCHTGHGSGGCGGCHAATNETMDTGSHAAHLVSARGPNGVADTTVSCDTCHGAGATSGSHSGHFSGEPDFADGQALATTTVCDMCHSPGGSYDGVDSSDDSVGARDNWAVGVYETTSTLRPDSQKWCAGCHDEMPAQVAGVDASNVIGDESAEFGYGTGWGFYKTGHGLQEGFFPATVAPAAGLECAACHDLGASHIDGDARTYDVTTGDYQDAYRLASVSGGDPLEIPRVGPSSGPYTGIADPQDFALCLDACHAADLYTDPTEFTTNFREGVTRNSHAYHLNSNGATVGRWDSDWDGTADSMPSCPACHNVHGSPSPAMVRHGELIGRSPALDFVYTTPEAINYPKLAESEGGLLDLPPGGGSVASNGVCVMCHSQLVGYSRSPAPLLGTAPSTPVNLSPPSGAGDTTTTPELESSAFLDLDGDFHMASQWQVSETSGDYSSLAVDSGVTAVDLTSYSVTDALDEAVTYYWRVRYWDSSGAWSAWSSETSFTTESGAAPQMRTLHPTDVSDDASGYWTPQGGSWPSVLDSDDGDTSYARGSTGAAGQTLYMSMDDLSGLSGATITGLRVHARVRYLAGPWPGAVPLAGNVDIGYRTGGATQWSGSSLTDTSGSYVLVSSGSFATDADGGPLDVSDIQALEVSVKRATAGAASMRITEVFAEVDYTP